MAIRSPSTPTASPAWPSIFHRRGRPRSEFQRVLTALGISHLVAPSPEAKGKSERRFGTFQKRRLALLAFERITRYDAAQAVLDHEVERQNRTLCRTTGLSPDEAWNKALEEGRTAMRRAPDSSLLLFPQQVSF